MGEESTDGHACLLDLAPDFGQGRPVLAKRGHRERWDATQTNALLEYSPVNTAL